MGAQAMVGDENPNVHIKISVTDTSARPSLNINSILSN